MKCLLRKIEQAALSKESRDFDKDCKYNYDEIGTHPFRCRGKVIGFIDQGRNY